MSHFEHITGSMDIVQVLDEIMNVLVEQAKNDPTNSSFEQWGSEVVSVLGKWSEDRHISEPSEDRKRNTFFQADFNRIERSTSSYDMIIRAIGALKRRF